MVLQERPISVRRTRADRTADAKTLPGVTSAFALLVVQVTQANDVYANKLNSGRTRARTSFAESTHSANRWTTRTPNATAQPNIPREIHTCNVRAFAERRCPWKKLNSKIEHQKNVHFFLIPGEMKKLPSDCRTNGCGKGAVCQPTGSAGSTVYICQCPPGTTGSPQKECSQGKSCSLYHNITLSVRRSSIYSTLCYKI
jgi:hypothetical protein